MLGTAAEPGTATGSWRPDRSLIAEIEAKLVMPEGAGPLSGYARQYTGVTEGGRAKVRGSFIAYGFVPRSTPPVTIVKELVPLIEDGGCAVVNLEFDVASTEMRLACNGEA